MSALPILYTSVFVEYIKLSVCYNCSSFFMAIVHTYPKCIYTLCRNAFCGQIQCEDGGMLKTTPGQAVKYNLVSLSFLCKCVQ